MKSLTSVIIKNAKRQEKQENIKDKVLSFLAFIIVFGFLSVSMTWISIIVTQKLKEINQSYMFINILLLMNFIILFAKSIFESLNVLYFSKDLNQLLRMPLKPKDIVHAKMLTMILSEYQMEIIMLAIPIIIYGIIMKTKILFYIYALIVLLLLPILPIVTTSLIISIIMSFANKLKNKTTVMYITIILTAILINTLFISPHLNNPSNTNLETALLQENGVSTTIANKFSLIKPIMKLLLNYKNIIGIKNLIFYILENLFIYIIGILIISKLYLKGAIGTTINSKKSQKESKLKLHELKKKNKTKSYILKEIKTTTRTPIFLLQCILIPIIYPIIIFAVFIAAIIFTHNINLDIIKEFLNIITTSTGQAIFIGVSQVFFMMNFCSIIGISKDSKAAILIKTFPIKLEKQFNIKTMIGKRINLLSSLIVTFCYYYTIRNIQATIVIFSILYLLNEIGEKIKLLIDSNKPQINWDNEYTMMKQNSNVMNVLFYTLAILLTLFILSKIINQATYFLTTVLILSFIGYISINFYIIKNAEKIFSKIY